MSEGTFSGESTIAFPARKKRVRLNALGLAHLGYGSFSPLLADFVRTPVPPKTPSKKHFNFVGSLWRAPDVPSLNLHEVEVGKMSWAGETLVGARVRLFASYGLPSYHVAVGS
jgi:hypothetical protein